MKWMMCAPFLAAYYLLTLLNACSTCVTVFGSSSTEGLSQEELALKPGWIGATSQELERGDPSQEGNLIAQAQNPGKIREKSEKRHTSPPRVFHRRSLGNNDVCRRSPPSSLRHALPSPPEPCGAIPRPPRLASPHRPNRMPCPPRRAVPYLSRAPPRLAPPQPCPPSHDAREPAPRRASPCLARRAIPCRAVPCRAHPGPPAPRPPRTKCPPAHPRQASCTQTAAGHSQPRGSASASAGAVRAGGPSSTSTLREGPPPTFPGSRPGRRRPPLLLWRVGWDGVVRGWDTALIPKLCVAVRIRDSRGRPGVPDPRPPAVLLHLG